MRSAYLVLGVPGDASGDEIEAALRRSEAQFPRERLAEEEGALARLAEIRTAYQVLHDPDSRAAHDRKLQAQVRPPAPRPRTVLVVQEASPMRKVMAAGVWVLAAVLASGVYVSYRNAEARRVAAAQEEQTRKAAERDAEARRQEQERTAAERALRAERAEANDRRLLLQASQASASRVAADQRMQEAALAQSLRQEQAEVQRRESQRQNEERRAAAEARQRTERDKQRVREICWRVYGRPDC